MDPSPLLVALGAAYFFLAYFALTLDRETVNTVIASEDGYFENLGALGFFAASVLLFGAFWRLRRTRRLAGQRLFCVLLALACFFVAGEEIAWGQHLLGFEAPQRVKDVNALDEVTVHNIDALYEGDTPPIKWIGRGFSVFGLAFLLGVPLAVSYRPRWRFAIERFLPVVGIGFGVLFVLNYLALRLAYWLSPSDIKYAAWEIQESNVGLLFAALGIALYRRR